MTADTKPLAWFSWSLNSNTGLSTSGSQDGITPEMYGAIMGVLAGRFPEAEIARLQAQVDALAGALQAQDALSKKGLLQAESGEIERVAKLRKEALATVGR